jgi:acyl-coenzyme A synthetase/AMP-(fatty) acid ligase
MVTGEPCPMPLVTEWSRPSRPLWNLYGPTESTCSCTYGKLLPGQPVDIGVPIPSYACEIVDPDTLRPVSSDSAGGGMAGELIVCGVSVVRGYLNRPEKTAAQFVQLPDGRRAYRTGDRARRTERGTIELLGRFDAQVKIRGQRVELEGLEAVLASAPFVWQCLFSLDKATGLLHAVVVPQHVAACDDDNAEPADGGGGAEPQATIALTLGKIREHMQGRVPPYCQPQCLHVWDIAAGGGFPTTSSGKCDRTAVNLWLTRQIRTEAAVAEGEAQLGN